MELILTMGQNNCQTRRIWSQTTHVCRSICCSCNQIVFFHILYNYFQHIKTYFCRVSTQNYTQFTERMTRYPKGEGDHLWYAVFRFLRRYPVRKGLVRSTQKFCYIVRRHHILPLKGPIFIKKHNTHDITKSNNSKTFARSLCSRFLGVIWQYLET